MNNETEYHRMLMGWALALCFAIILILGSRVWDLRETTQEMDNEHTRAIKVLQTQVQMLTSAALNKGEVLRGRVMIDDPEDLLLAFPKERYVIEPDPQQLPDFGGPREIELTIRKK